MRFPAPLLVLTLDSCWTNTIGIGSSQSASHHFYAVDRSANNTLAQRLVCHSFSRLSHSCHTLSRWSWSAPLHRNNTSLGPQPPPLFESSRLHDLNHLTLRFPSPRGCARFTVKIRRPRVCLHLLLHKTLHPSNQTHSHHFVPMSATFDSVETCFVANFFSSMACRNHSHFTSIWRHFPATQLATESQWSTSVFRWLSSFVTGVFHQQASCCSRSLCIELRLS